MEEQLKIKSLLESVNIAEDLDEDKLTEIGQTCSAGFEADVLSRQDWEQQLDCWIDLAKQVAEEKTYPWPGAANVKYPLLSTAAMQFAARAYPSLVPSDRRVVKARPIGKDPTGQLTQMAEAISLFMSYQLMEEMQGWEEDMDKLLIMLPIVGTMFKKTYWDSVKKVNCSKLVLPKNLVVNYWARSLREAERVSEILEVPKRKVKERQNAELWLDIDLGDPPMPDNVKNAPANDATTPYIIIEQHTYLDLDDDGYEEPYIVTFHRESKKVLRIVARFDDSTITMTSSDNPDVDPKLAMIEPIQYYTKFGFVPNPDGGFYDIGFGVLLGPLNESVNTLINQLLDAGHLHSLQSGFLGKGLRLRMGETRFTPGEWKAVNATGTDLKQQILPLPTKEPSKVLFELMGSLISSGKELASVAEIFVGKMPGQNTPATTTMATIEQGMKVFTAVYKRIYRALDEEFQKLFRLNGVYLQPGTEIPEIIGMTVSPEDFDYKSQKIFPGADPTAISQTEKLMKAQGLMELLPTGVLDPVAVVTRVLEAQEQPRWEQLLSQAVKQTGQLPPPPPDPKLQEMQMKGQMEQQKMALDSQQAERKAELESRSQQAQLAMKAQEHAVNLQAKQREIQLKAAEAQHKQAIFSAQQQQQMNMQAMQHQQSMQHTEQTHQQNLKTQEEVGKAKAKQASQKPAPKKDSNKK